MVVGGKKKSGKRSMRKSKASKKSVKKSGKRKPTPYIKFMKKYFANHKGQDVTKVVKQGAAEWRKMSQAEKNKYK